MGEIGEECLCAAVAVVLGEDVPTMFDDRGFGEEEFAGDGIVVWSAGQCIEPSKQFDAFFVAANA